MCGFAGVIAWDERYRVSRETLAKMSARIAHRGPDGERLWFNHEDPATPITPDRPQAALAFRRLAILDLDERSMQPFTTDGRRWLVFNGEIYNFRELRAEIDRANPGYAWRTTGDTEVLLRAYETWGEKCVEHLNGMFAFAVWDEEKNLLFFARDRMGQKPLFYAAVDGAVAFASELSALRVPGAFLGCFTVNSEALGDYLHLGYFGEKTIYNGVQAWPPGKCGWGGRESGLRGYFSFGNLARAGSAEEPRTFKGARGAVQRAVRRQLVSDVPLGVFLSGGIDSSIIAVCAREAGPVHSFSIGFHDARYDESRFAELVARHLGTQHQVFHVTPSAITDLPKLAAAFGEPFADSSALPTHYLSVQCRKFVKVALSGDGGDELFGGYDRYRALVLADSFNKWPHPLRSTAVRVAKLCPGWHPKSPAVRLRRFAQGLQLPAARRYESYVELFDFSFIDSLLLHPYRPPDPDMPTGYSWFSNEFECIALADAVQNARALDVRTYLPGDLLTKVDRCSMLHGLEVRSPFMDHELVQFAAGLTTDQLLKGGPKRMLREAFADDLPAWVFKRKKMGFAVPIGEWFRGELRPMLRDTLFSSHAFGRIHFNMKVVERLVEEHETQRVDHSQRLYALLMLELWWNTVRS
jgi:asparagine synthase (glutamine-hydrolysing)